MKYEEKDLNDVMALNQFYLEKMKVALEDTKLIKLTNLEKDKLQDTLNSYTDILGEVILNTYILAKFAANLEEKMIFEKLRNIVEFNISKIEGAMRDERMHGLLMQEK